MEKELCQLAMQCQSAAKDLFELLNKLKLHEKHRLPRILKSMRVSWSHAGTIERMERRLLRIQGDLDSRTLVNIK